MANIRMRQGRYQAQVRRHGYRQETKTFTSTVSYTHLTLPTIYSV